MIHVGPALPADFEAVYHFINLLEETVFDHEVQERQYLRLISREDTLYLVATYEGKTVGFISVHAQFLLHHSRMVAEIQELFVLDGYRSLGVGAALVHEAEKLSQEKGWIDIEVTSNIKREKAHAFYLREGYGQTHLKFTKKNPDKG
jgi:(aminoalkyl)phosphonate N-acetyltransferase